MPVTEPYTAAFEALRDTLVSAGSGNPFVDDNQVMFHIPQVDDEQTPLKLLAQRLTQNPGTPYALVTDGGSTFTYERGDLDAEELWKVTLFYGVRTPGGDKDTLRSFSGVDNEYFGEFEIRKWIIDRISMQDTPSTGTVFRFELQSREVRSTNSRALLIGAFEMEASLIHTYSAVGG